jgi:uncharacterized RDD family membrane protein YckC
MSTATDNNPFAPPTTHVEDVASDAQELGGRGARLGAGIVDGLIQGGIYYAIAIALLPSLMPSDAFSIGSFALQLVVSLLMYTALHGYLLLTQGQTIGKKLLGLRIVRSNGERAGIVRVLGLRTFLGWALTLVPVVGMVYALADCLLIFRASHKCLHDNIADTIVVKA